MKRDQNPETFTVLTKLKNSIWSIGIPCWLFGITDRSVAAFTDSYLSLIEIAQLFTAFFFFMGWLCLKPEKTISRSNLSVIQAFEDTLSPTPANAAYLRPTQARMLELQEQHMISQSYTLPFPYLCQIYHLLNLKHLEKVHSFSLGNLRIIKVSDFQMTNDGGVIKFQTMLDSPMNALRLWRQPIVEVELVLHAPYTVELSIPVYNGKRMVVLFNVLPIDSAEHQLLIDIYSDLKWPRPILQLLLHIASSLTLFEDLPYLRKLAERNVSRLVNAGQLSNHETMLLFNRFVDLYASAEFPQLAGSAA